MILIMQINFPIPNLIEFLINLELLTSLKLVNRSDQTLLAVFPLIQFQLGQLGFKFGGSISS